MDKNQTDYAYCVNHPSKHAKHFCEYSACKALICNSCALAKHTAHLTSLKSLSDLYASNTDYLNKILREYQKKFGKENEFACLASSLHKGKYYCEKCKGFVCEECTLLHEKGHALLDKDKFMNQLKLSVDLFMSYINYSYSEPYGGVEMMELNRIRKDLNKKVVELIQIKQKIEEIAEKRKEFIITTIRKLHKDLFKKKKPIFPSQEVLANVKTLYEKLALEKDYSGLFKFYSKFKLIIDSFLANSNINNSHLNSISQSIKAIEGSLKEHNDTLINELTIKNKANIKGLGYYCKTVQDALMKNDESLRKNMSEILKMKSDELTEAYPVIAFDNCRFSKYKSPNDSKSNTNQDSFNNKVDHSSFMIKSKAPSLVKSRFDNVLICQGHQLAFIQSLELFGLIKMNQASTKSLQGLTPNLEIKRKDNNFVDSLEFNPPQIETVNRITDDIVSLFKYSPDMLNKRSNEEYGQVRNHRLFTTDEEEIYKMIRLTSKNTNGRILQKNLSELEITLDYQNETRGEGEFQLDLSLQNSSFKQKLNLLNQKYQEKGQLREIEELISLLSIEERNMIEILCLHSNLTSIISYNPYLNTKEELRVLIRGNQPFQSFPRDSSFLNVQPYAYISGGKTEKKELKILYRIQRLSNGQFTFTSLCSLRESRSGHTSTYFRPSNSIYFLSGSKTKSCEKYNIDTNTIEALPELNMQRERCSCCFINDSYLFVFFGFNANKDHGLSSIEKLELKRKLEWKAFTLPGHQSLLKRYGSSCFRYEYDGRKGILIVGGNNSTRSEMNDALFFSIDNYTAYWYTSFPTVYCSFNNADYYSLGNSKVNISEKGDIISFDKKEGFFY